MTSITSDEEREILSRFVDLVQIFGPDWSDTDELAIEPFDAENGSSNGHLLFILTVGNFRNIANLITSLNADKAKLLEALDVKDTEIIRLSRELGLGFNREEDYVNQIEDCKRRSGRPVRG